VANAILGSWREGRHTDGHGDTGLGENLESGLRDEASTQHEHPAGKSEVLLANKLDIGVFTKFDSFFLTSEKTL
jgi:hypothetical protein